MATMVERTRAPLGSERRFYLGMAIAILAIMFAGFAPTFYLRGLVPPYSHHMPMSPLVLLHGLLFTLWLILFMSQVSLVSARRPDIHRKLGIAGFAMLPAMVIVGFLAAIGGVARHSGPPEFSPLTWLAVPLLDIPVFTGLIGAALYCRRNPQVHKRLMLCALISLTPPGTARLPWLQTYMSFPVVVIGGQMLLLAALAMWDLKSRGRVHPVTMIATIVILASWVGRFAIWETEPWLAFAGWVASFA
jgi:hypothetical protein